MKLITRDDVLCCGLSIYHIERKILENDEIFQDGTHIIYVNSKKQEDTELGRLMHDLHCKDAKDMHSEILAKRVYELKETPKGVENMCREMEELLNEGMEIGKLEKSKETATELYKIGMEIEKIAEILKISPTDVQKWISETK